jgi:glucan phosphoethanolaminetransferase (alkaline phosphatase superfamily)
MYSVPPYKEKDREGAHCLENFKMTESTQHKQLMHILIKVLNQENNFILKQIR